MFRLFVGLFVLLSVLSATNASARECAELPRGEAAVCLDHHLKQVIALEDQFLKAQIGRGIVFVRVAVELLTPFLAADIFFNSKLTKLPKELSIFSGEFSKLNFLGKAKAATVTTATATISVVLFVDALNSMYYLGLTEPDYTNLKEQISEKKQEIQAICKVYDFQSCSN